jgi:hypothetical protein
MARVYYVSENIDRLLASRASGCQLTKSELANQLLATFMDQPVYITTEFAENPDDLVRRQYHINTDLDKRMTQLALVWKVTRGQLFRVAMRSGLGVI